MKLLTNKENTIKILNEYIDYTKTSKYTWPDWQYLYLCKFFYNYVSDKNEISNFVSYWIRKFYGIEKPILNRSHGFFGVHDLPENKQKRIDFCKQIINHLENEQNES